MTKHLKRVHGVTPEEYTVKYTLSGCIPMCACGCGKTVDVKGYRVNKYLLGHSGGGNWQLKYEKDSPEYAGIVEKLSDSVRAKTIGVAKSESHRTSISLGRKRWIADNRLEFDASSRKMRDTKQIQSKSGVLAAQHYTRTREDAQIIYKMIAHKSAITKRKMFSNGELSVWNRGKTSTVDGRILSGNRHYKFNPHIERSYTPLFNDKQYRHVLLQETNGGCFACKSSDDLCLHHINENKKDDSMRNLIFLCRRCHTKLHNSFTHKREMTKLIRNFKHTLYGDTEMGYLNNSSVTVDAID